MGAVEKITCFMGVRPQGVFLIVLGSPCAGSLLAVNIFVAVFESFPENIFIVPHKKQNVLKRLKPVSAKG